MGFKPDTECRSLGGKFYTYKHKKIWQLIYYHDLSKAGKWDSTNDALNYNHPYKYSVIDSIDESYIINDGYEFLLEYPEKNGYNNWIQTNFPLNEIEEDDKRYVVGYTPIHISWTSQHWGGLFKSSSSSTLIDGSYLKNIAWYAIGRISIYEGAVPGPGSLINKTLLWIRVSSHVEKSCKLRCKDNRSQALLVFLFALNLEK